MMTVVLNTGRTFSAYIDKAKRKRKMMRKRKIILKLYEGKLTIKTI